MAADNKSIVGSDQNIFSYIKDISNANASKLNYVDGLKYDYEKVQVEVKMKMDELKKIRESNAHLQDYLSSHKFMMNELQKTESTENEVISSSEDTARSLREEMAKLRAIKNEDLISYEERVTNITNNFISGPYSFSKNILSDKMQRLAEIHEEVQRQLVSIKNDLEATHKKFNLVKDSVVDEPSSEYDILRIPTEKENSKITSETDKLESEMNSLGNYSSGLQKEVQSLKGQLQSLEN